MTIPRMFYFGPWREPGHFLHREGGWSVYRHEERAGFPWNEWSGENGIDGQLQPGCYHDQYGHWRHGAEVEGEALLHHKDGWTALSFWDRSVDHRGACNSTYFTEGTFTFEQMAEMAKARFSERWSRMNFEVRLAP